MNCRRGWLLLWSLWGCDPQSSLLVFTVKELPSRATQLSVKATLDGQPATNGQSFMAPVDRFAVRLPPEASGQLALRAQALDSDSCVQADSMAVVNLPAGAVNLDLSLTAQRPRKCGSLAPCADKAVCSTSAPTNQTIQRIWVIAMNDIWAVGNGTTLVHFDGDSWTVKPVPIGAAGNLNGIWASAKDNVWAVGDLGLILHYDGTSWSTVPSPTTLRLWAIWGVTNSDIWAVGDSVNATSQAAVLHYDGTKWLAVTNPGLGVGQLNSVWAASSNFVYACGVGGLLARYDGASWNPIVSNTTTNLHAIWGTPGGLNASTVFAVGDNGSIFRIRYALDTQWSKLPSSGTGNTLYDIYGDGNQVVYAVGSGGIIVRAAPPYDAFVAQNNPFQATLFTVRTGASGLIWTGGNGGFLGYLDSRP